jgi:hypothetical protein
MVQARFGDRRFAGGALRKDAPAELALPERFDNAMWRDFFMITPSMISYIYQGCGKRSPWRKESDLNGRSLFKKNLAFSAAGPARLAGDDLGENR